MPDQEQDNLEHALTHVFDLPQLYTHPGAPELLDTLARLAVRPTSWGAVKDKEDDDRMSTPISEDGVPKYLTSIIASQLGWIGGDEVRERIWEAASCRLSERSGRTAQPTITRTFNISFQQPDKPGLQITLVEPSLTADNLGHKTWLASFLLARRLPSLLSQLRIYHLGGKKPLYSSILELGSGTGLLGIAAAALLPIAKARLTDLPDIVGNLEKNVEANAGLFAGRNVPVVRVLDWSIPNSPASAENYDLILASDPLYSPQHPAWLVQSILSNLSPEPHAQVIIELPLRDAYLGEVSEMRRLLLDGGLQLLDSGEESGREDWSGNNGGAGAEVKCWWGVWGRHEAGI